MQEKDKTRRKVLIGLTSAVGLSGIPFAATPFIAAWNPSAKAKASGASVKIDVSKMRYGQQIQVAWRKQPVFVVRHTKESLGNLGLSVPKLADPNSDAIEEPYKNLSPTRSQSDEYSVLTGVCTHLGCVPLGESGDFGGWYCPCHGSHYDTAGRIRKGPAPRNLDIPVAAFIDETTIQLG